MRRIGYLIVIALVLTACSSMNCPISHTVHAKFKLGETLTDTLTVRVLLHNGTDSVLLNRLVSADSFYLPMSYQGDVDVYYFDRIDSTGTTTDEVRVSKTNHPHFEAVECNPSVFHTITGVTHTYNKLDSIVVGDKDVNYDATKTHFRVYFK